MTERLIEACKKLAEAEPGRFRFHQPQGCRPTLCFPPNMVVLDMLTSDEVDEIAAELGMEVEDSRETFAFARRVCIRQLPSQGYLSRLEPLGLEYSKREARIEGLIRAIEIYLAMSGRKEGVK